MDHSSQNLSEYAGLSREAEPVQLAPEQGRRLKEVHPKTYLIRNKIAHGGMDPTFYDAQLAVKHAIDLRHYIVALIKAKSNKYPNRAMYFPKPKTPDNA